jgi:hypothetical protein
MIIVDTKLLKKQINDLLKSNIPEASKEGLHNLLGTIKDEIETSLTIKLTDSLGYMKPKIINK